MLWYSVYLLCCSIEGVQPSLNLLTSDGAILADEDPLSLVIGPAELQASITSWNLPPVGERYIECCSQLKTGQANSGIISIHYT